ncbi:MAG: hypothetical protein HGA54_04525 [Actinobacteria bacterium]|nr:hypothetical protein [Actinomycetota bacterium]
MDEQATPPTPVPDQASYPPVQNYIPQAQAAAPAYPSQIPMQTPFANEELTTAEKAYVIILTIFGNILIPITCWFCWRNIAPIKARKALILGIIVAVIMAILSCAMAVACWAMFAASFGGMMNY